MSQKHKKHKYLYLDVFSTTQFDKDIEIQIC